MRTLLVVFALGSFVAASTVSYVARAETAGSQPAAVGTKATKNKKAKKPALPTRAPTASLAREDDRDRAGPSYFEPRIPGLTCQRDRMGEPRGQCRLRPCGACGQM
jgi:hypothetical protein